MKQYDKHDLYLAYVDVMARYHKRLEKLDKIEQTERKRFYTPSKIKEMYQNKEINASQAVIELIFSLSKLPAGCYVQQKTIAKKLDMPYETVKRVVKKLAKDQALKREGLRGQRMREWTLLPNAKNYFKGVKITKNVKITQLAHGSESTHVFKNSNPLTSWKTTHHTQKQRPIPQENINTKVFISTKEKKESSYEEEGDSSSHNTSFKNLDAFKEYENEENYDLRNSKSLAEYYHYRLVLDEHKPYNNVSDDIKLCDIFLKKFWQVEHKQLKQIIDIYSKQLPKVPGEHLNFTQFTKFYANPRNWSF